MKRTNETKARTEREMLDALCAAVREYSYSRDLEWEFADEHGTEAEYWTDEDAEEHDKILQSIQANRDAVNALIREAKGRSADADNSDIEI